MAWDWGVLAQGTRHDVKSLSPSDPKLYYTFKVERTTKITIKLTSLKDVARLDVWDPTNRGIAGVSSGKRRILPSRSQLMPGHIS